MRARRLLAWLLVCAVVVAPAVGSDTPGGRWIASQYLDGPEPDASAGPTSSPSTDALSPGEAGPGSLDGASTRNGTGTGTETGTGTRARPGSSDRADGRGVGLASGSGDVLGAQRVHELGVTGERVRVGVIGGSFDADHGAIDRAVAAHRRLAPETPLPASEHDTAVAEVVAETAPGASLYLVGIGRRPTATRYERAVDWLVASEVDVVVDAGSYFPREPAAADRITAAAESASARGVVFVTSAGNYARRHWTGTGTTSGWVTVERPRSSDVDGSGRDGAPPDRDGDTATAEAGETGATQVNHLANGRTTRGVVSLRLRWSENGTGADTTARAGTGARTTPSDYDLYVYRRLRGPDRVVAKSATDGGRSEAIDVRVPSGRYYVAIYARNGSADDRLELFSAHQSLSHATPEGSVLAPATGDEVITVGATTPGDGGVAAYSSRGSSVDVLGPGTYRTRVAGRFSGSSAAAPFVAGTAALMRSRDASITPAETEHILRRSAGDSRNGTAEAEAGAVAGIDPLAAVRRAAADTPAPDPGNRTDRGATGSSEPSGR